MHGIFLLGGAVFTCVAFFAGLMYLAQMRRLKAKRPSRTGLALPSLEQSERINRGAITVAFPLLDLRAPDRHGPEPRGAGRGPRAPRDPLDRPEGPERAGMWLVFAVLLHARFRPAMRGRSMMVLTIVAFAFLVFTWCRRRGAAAAHGPWRGHGEGRREGDDAVRLLAMGVDHRSAPASVREALAFDGPRCAAGLEAAVAGLPRQRAGDPLHLQPGRGVPRRRGGRGSPRSTR